MSEIALTVKERLDWYDAMTFDATLSHISVRVGYAIGAHLNKFSARTFLSHDYLGLRLGVSTKTIERSVRQLEEHGYLSVRRSPGRGYANVYRAIIPIAAPERSGGRVAENPTTLSKKPDTVVPETRHGCLPYPSILPNSITPKRESVPPSPPATSQQEAQVHEPEIVRLARLQEQGDQKRIEAALADMLTIGGDINGHEVLLNTGPQELAILMHRHQHGALTPDDIAQTQGAYCDLRARGRALEFMPEPH